MVWKVRKKREAHYAKKVCGVEIINPASALASGINIIVSFAYGNAATHKVSI